MQIQIQANNVLWAVQRQRSGRLVAWCDLLGLTVEGDNEPDLASMIAESIHVLFVDLLQDGELPQFLLDHGWTANGPVPIQLPDGGVSFNLPWGMLPATSASSPP